MHGKGKAMGQQQVFFEHAMINLIHLNSLIFGRKQEGSTVRAEQVQVVDQTTLPPKCHSFVGLDRQIGSSPPVACYRKKKYTGDSLKQRLTHTHTPMELSLGEQKQSLVPALPMVHRLAVDHLLNRLKVFGYGRFGLTIAR